MVYNPKCLKNLKPFQKGQEPPPGVGRPEGSVSVVSALKAHLREHPETIQAVVKDWLAGVKDNPALLKELLDRTDGKVPQPEQHSGEIRLVVDWAGNEAQEPGRDKT